MVSAALPSGSMLSSARRQFLHTFFRFQELLHLLRSCKRHGKQHNTDYEAFKANTGGPESFE